MRMDKHASRNPFQMIKDLKKDNQGTVSIIVGLSIFMLLGFGALAVDLGYGMLVRNELQNAADAGALAGAGNLYISNGTQVNVSADQTAYDTANKNTSQKETVCMNPYLNLGPKCANAPAAGSYESSDNDIQRGHWSFATQTFTPNPSTAPANLWDLTTAELDADTDFINAVRVSVRTQNPVASFFSRIWGGSPSYSRAQAIAYIGFAGTLKPGEVDLPIAICKQAIEDANGNYTCNRGRMINSGNNSGNETGGWTNYDQAQCRQPTRNDVPLTRSSCAGSNVAPITLGLGMGLTNGEIQTTFDDGLLPCWVTLNGGSGTWQGNTFNILTWPNRIWSVSLPVVDCSSGVSNCSEVVGAVQVNIVWITRNDKNAYLEVPRQMGDWTCPTGFSGAQCWESFRDYFDLKQTLGDQPAIYENVTIYFQPDCTPHELSGNTGGENFGILAKIPKLVK